MESITHKFENGVVITGTYDQIKQAADAFGELVSIQGYYLSSTKGLIKISQMNTEHIKNALAKRAYMFYQNLANRKDLSVGSYLIEFVKLTHDKNIVELYDELVKRA